MSWLCVFFKIYCNILHSMLYSDKHSMSNDAILFHTVMYNIKFSPKWSCVYSIFKIVLEGASRKIPDANRFRIELWISNVLIQY